MKRKVSQEAVTFLFGKMWQFAEGHRHLVVLFLAMSVIANLALLTQPLIFGEFLNEIQRNGFGAHNIKYLVLTLLGFLVIEVVFWLFHGPSRLIENITAFRTERRYREHLLSGVMGLGLSWHALRDSGDTIDKVNKASEGLLRFSRHLFRIVEVLVRAIGVTAILLFFNVYIGLFALALLVIALLILFQFDLRLIPQHKALNVFDNKISARIFDALSNITTVKVLHIEKPVLEGIRQSLWAPFSLYRANMILNEMKWFTGSSLFSLLIVLPLLIYMAFSLREGSALEIGTVSALYMYLSRLFDVFFAFAGEYEEKIVNKTRILNAEEIEDAFSAQKTLRKAVSRWQSVQVCDVLFKYEDVDHGAHHIKDVSLDFSHGESIALIGESGSGKTTFLKIIHGMYPNARAKIGFDGKKPYATNFADLDLATTLVPQEPEVFSASIRENITLGVEYSDVEILKATDLAEFTGVVGQLPRGLDSVINEKGVNLSGGQKQRLALARALLFANGKEVILLDESTSSVDPETEVRIYQNIFSHFDGKTVLASIHKMNLLKYFDRIVIFAKGEIVDQGTFDELLERNEKFQRDWAEYVAQNAGANS